MLTEHVREVCEAYHLPPLAILALLEVAVIGIATCSADGTPNVTAISDVLVLDDDTIAIMTIAEKMSMRQPPIRRKSALDSMGASTHAAFIGTWASTRYFMSPIATPRMTSAPPIRVTHLKRTRGRSRIMWRSR